MTEAGRPIRVMLVDDHLTVLWGLRSLVQSAWPRMEVVGTATSCDNALAQIAELAPDVVLLDMDLNGDSGIDVLVGLAGRQSTRVLVLTGVRDQEILDAAILHRAHGILSKEAPADQVLKAIEKIHDGEFWLERETVGRVLGKMINGAGTAPLDPEALKQGALTAKERVVIRLIVDEHGACNKTLAKRLSISEHTLRNHLTAIYQKLNLRNRLELYVYATKHHLGDDSQKTG